MHFEPSRSAALTRLADFLPDAGKAYANGRNYDDGVPSEGLRKNVSQLSPWLHAGLISEAEVVDAVLSKHSAQAADKYIAEVFWRVYFKGYLEQRPTIWTSYCERRDSALARLSENSGLQTAYDEAVQGRTGIAAFDRWALELNETGYLHNHARMWFASIWIFTLKLDWTLGADFFLRHLIDGDAASNTLSWRWVGGLHTKGKTYLAREDNIARYTANQLGGPLSAEGLSHEAEPLEESEEHGRQTLDLPGPITSEDLSAPFALILHDEAASHVPLNLPAAPAVVIWAARSDARSPDGASDKAREFAHSAAATGAKSAAKEYYCPLSEWSERGSLMDILTEYGAQQIAYPYLPAGWTRDALWPQIEPLSQDGRASALLDDLSRATWPFAKAGFFGVKKKIESVLGEVGINGSQVPSS